MADFLYDNYREEAMKGIRDLSTEVIKVVCVTDAYSATTAHTCINDIPGAARASTPVALSSVVVTNGILDSADVTITAVSAVSAVAAVVFFIEAATSASSTLIVNLNSGTGLPLTTNGGNVVLQWDNGVNKIFKL